MNEMDREEKVRSSDEEELLALLTLLATEIVERNNRRHEPFCNISTLGISVCTQKKCDIACVISRFKQEPHLTTRLLNL